MCTEGIALNIETIDHLTCTINNLTKIVSANDNEKPHLARDIARFIMLQQINLEKIRKEYDELKAQLDELNGIVVKPKCNVIQFPG